jgi:hypothetical protein
VKKKVGSGWWIHSVAAGVWIDVESHGATEGKKRKGVQVLLWRGK